MGSTAPAFPVRFGWGWLHPWLRERQVSTAKALVQLGVFRWIRLFSWSDCWVHRVPGKIMTPPGDLKSQSPDFQSYLGTYIRHRSDGMCKHVDEKQCPTIFLNLYRWQYLGSKWVHKTVYLCQIFPKYVLFPQAHQPSSRAFASQKPFALSGLALNMSKMGHPQHSWAGNSSWKSPERGHYRNGLSISRCIRKMQLSSTGE